MKKTAAFGTTLLGILALSLLGCPDKTIQVAVVLPLTGDYVVYGEPIRRGIEMAVAENAADPESATPVNVSYVDTESDPEKASELLREQYRSGALVAIGGVTSPEAMAMITVVDDVDRVLLSPSATSPDLTGISRNFYRICPSDFTAGTRMAQFASQNLKIETVVVIAEEQTYAKGIQEVFQTGFEDQGGQIVELIEIPPFAGDISGLIGRVMTLKPDGVYLAAYEAGNVAIIQELDNLGYNGKILTTDALTDDGIARLGSAAEDIFLTKTVFEIDSDHAHVVSFVEAYQEKYEEPPDLYAARGYDAMRVLIAALADRPPLHAEVIKGLRDSITEFPGVTGSIRFDEKGDVRKYPRIYVVGQGGVLYDYNDRVRQQQENIRKQREKLRRELERIQRQASEIAGDG